MEHDRMAKPSILYPTGMIRGWWHKDPTTGDQTPMVTVQGAILDDHYSGQIGHYAGGFSWGYRGSGPQHLALALLLLHTDDATALALYRDFLHDEVEWWPREETFTYPVASLLAWLQAHGVSTQLQT